LSSILQHQKQSRRITPTFQQVHFNLGKPYGTAQTNKFHFFGTFFIMDELIPSQHHTTLVSSPKSYGCFLFFLNEVKWVKQKREIENCAHNNDIRFFFFLDLFYFSFRSYMEGPQGTSWQAALFKKKIKKKIKSSQAASYVL
jgi:hypothetical protein